MAEADTLRALTRTGGVRLIKRSFGEIPVTDPAPPPASSPMSAPTEPEKKEPALSVSSGPLPKVSPTINLSGNKTPLPPADALPPGVTIFRRRTKIADVARIVLPPRRDEAERLAAAAAIPVQEPAPTPPPTSPAPAPAAVIPPSFPVAVSTGSVMQPETSERDPAPFPPSVQEKKPETVQLPQVTPESSTPPVENPAPLPEMEKVSIASIPPPPEPEKKEEPVNHPPPAAPPAPEASFPASKPPTVPLPKMNAPADPPASEPAPASTSLQTSDGREKREFMLSNGERILGTILSETPEAIYIDHGTLGVLTIPRSQIAQRPIEIILINGDRIVGDIIAETTDALFVRHASLGILTVPHNQRSTRVVEAILKDGDRILGEVLGETENFTVIRSATLGTVAVPHNRVAMLNRKVEQVQMKALPPSAPELENKPAA